MLRRCTDAPAVLGKQRVGHRCWRSSAPQSANRRNHIRKPFICCDAKEQVSVSPRSELEKADTHSPNCIATGLGDVKCDVSSYEPQQPSAAQQAEPAGLFEQILSTALLVSPFFFWGTSMVAMKGVISHITPLLLGSFRLLPAGFLLIAWAARDGRPQPSTPIAWLWVLAFALVDGAAFQGFLAEGLARTSAGLGSVIIDSQPLTVAVLASLLFGEQLGALAVGGLLLGIVGLLLVELPQETMELAADGLLTGSGTLDLARLPGTLMSGSPFDSGEFWMLLAAQSMALGTIMVRYLTKHCDPVMATGWHMVLGGGMLLAAASAQQPGVLQETLAEFNLGDYLSMSYITLLGGAASYGIFFYNASKGNLTALSSLTFLTPLFAAGGGYLVLGEVLTPLQLVGAVVTLFAVYLINEQPKAKDTAA